MPEDSSLDAFASSADDGENDAEVAEKADSGENAGSEPDPVAEPEPTAESDADQSANTDQSAETEAETDSAAEAAESVEPTVSTYAWSSEGATCAACGESVERRWRAEGQRDGDLVCVDCKEW